MMEQPDLNLSQRTLLIEDNNSHVEVTLSPLPGRAGDVSPSSLYQRRRLSPVIVTTPLDAHEYALGRPAVVLPVPPQLEKEIKKPALLITSSTASTASSSSCSVSVKSPRRSKPPPVPKTITKRSCSTSANRPNCIRRLSSAPIQATDNKFLSLPSPLRLEAWTEVPGTTFSIRSANYLSNRKKCPSEQSVFRLLTVDLVQCEAPIMTGLCRHPNERLQQSLKREKETGVKELPDFVFAVNLAIPGPPSYHCVFYFGVDNVNQMKSQETPFGRLANKFFFGDSDAFRDETFKLIPRIEDGNFLVKSAVGSKPSIVGSKLKQVHIRDERFMELIVDIGSNSVAQKIVKLSLGYAKTMVVDMGFVLEGKSESELPEQTMGAVRLKNLDFEKRDGKRFCLAT